MSFIAHVFFFLVLSLVTAVVTAAIRLEDPHRILHEARHFFVAITVGVGIFCAIVYVLEWIFIRPLL